MKIKVLSVTEVNNYVKKIIDNDFILRNLSVKGEISNLTYHSSGHIYFSLKDQSGKISCVMFKGRAYELDFKLKEGMNVIVCGRLSIYPATGSIQLYCDTIEEEGIGSLHIQFQKLKEKLYNKGYFDDEHKKKIPEFPSRVGVVTSSTGAVFHDIINVAKRRNSLIDIVLYPARVQGDGAYKEIINGIQYFNNIKSVDVIIVARGGGSIEELWNFNEEELAEAIYKSKLPIVSAVGHEVDFTISDFVSDLRAATPSQAAEILFPVESAIREGLDYSAKMLNRIMLNRLDYEKQSLNSLEKVLNLNSPIAKIANCYLDIDKLYQKMDLNIKKRLEVEKERLNGINNLLIAHNPTNILVKGYAIIEDDIGIINTKERLKDQKNITINLKDGNVKGRFEPFK
jgi:exodeoxyribonuclease VII large subunit